MTRSILRKTYTGMTGEINGVRITLDGPNVRIKISDPSGEAYLTVNEFVRLVRHFHKTCDEMVTDETGWYEDNKALKIPKTPLFAEGVQKARERIREEERVPKYFRNKYPDADDLDVSLTEPEESGDAFLL